MHPTASWSRELVSCIQRRMAPFRLLERRLKERQAILRNAFAECFKAHRTQMRMITRRIQDVRYDQRI